MKIPEKEYSVGEFLDYLMEHSDEIFEEERKNWLKIYCILVSDNSWQTTLFKIDEITQLGAIFKVTPEVESSDEIEEIYYALEYSPGLLLLFTTANNERYKKSVENKIKKSRGTTPMWIKPDFFRRFWKETIEQNNGSFVYRFTSKRKLLDDTPSRIRPNYERRFNYTGDDGTQTMLEIEELYGVLPTSIYIQVNENLKLHLTNEGLFSAQEPSSPALSLFFNYLDEIKDPILKMRNISKSLNFNIASGESNLKSASVDVGVIKLHKREIDAYTVESLAKELKDFSFIDKNIEIGSLSFTSTVIDEIKGSVFDISASESEILIVPKYRMTFESLLGFYRGIAESIDEQAELSTIDERQ
ncbi:MAG: hypothetical protein O8C66_09910 [Candidatus Methanoperedens sp.]|nr:hypothetical protein [Candidatus Methanoperedens sp.]MCZ7370810.1 hypothetical protein [Candidatus Methanoperedens sp.]